MTVQRIALAFVLMLVATSPVAAAEPVISVWYRGLPAGTPRLGDLGVLRALGFNAVTWPRKFGKAEELQRFAETAGLKLIIADGPVFATPESALRPGERVDINVAAGSAAMLQALAWRAMAHGVRSISFDAGEPTGAGLDQKNGELKPWAREAIAVVRQMTGNSRLVDVLKPGPGVLVSPAADSKDSMSHALDVVLLDGVRSWVIVATNTSASAMRATVRLPSGAPYAMWISWIDGATLAMTDEPPGPRWNLELAPGAAKVYLIDKTIKLP